MPLFLEPDQQYDIVLESDMHYPEESRPTFIARSVTMKEHRELAALIESESASTAGEFFDNAVKAMKSILRGWRNMGSVPYDPSEIEGLLTVAEVREVVAKAMYNNHVSKEQKKSSESQP